LRGCVKAEISTTGVLVAQASHDSVSTGNLISSTAKVEYLYADLGTVNANCGTTFCTGNNGGAPVPVSVGLTENLVRVGVDANDLGFIQYEGGNANVPGFFGNLSQGEQARFMEFYRHSCHTAEDAHNYTSMVDAFVAMGSEYPAKFVEAGDVSRYGSWGALRYPGDTNPVWDAVVAFNARVQLKR
jgi:hypothetical protein